MGDRVGQVYRVHKETAFSFHTLLKTDKTPVLRYGETKASYNRRVGNYMDMLMKSGSGGRER